MANLTCNMPPFQLFTASLYGIQWWELHFWACLGVWRFKHPGGIKLYLILILAIPFSIISALEHAGVIPGVLLLILMSSLSFYTAYRILQVFEAYRKGQVQFQQTKLSRNGSCPPQPLTLCWLQKAQQWLILLYYANGCWEVGPK